MKFLALEKETANADWSGSETVLKKEAEHVLSLYYDGILREIYFDENRCAVLMLECIDKQTALAVLEDFPLVRAGLITFELIELLPYTGIKRLIESL